MKTSLKKFTTKTTLAAVLITLAAPHLPAAPTITTDYNDTDTSTPAFAFKNVPPPAATDAASDAIFTIVDGKRHNNSAPLDVLHDDKLPDNADRPRANFFFSDGSEKSRLQVDLRRPIDIRQVNTYSWHRGTRAPQAYTLYAADGTTPNFDPEPKNDTDPETCGWKRIAQVDTRPASEDERAPGQYAVSISDSDPAQKTPLGHYRYLLFEILPAQKDAGDQTFYSEIDVIDARAPAKPIKTAATGASAKGTRETFKTPDNAYQFTIDTTQAPEMTDWVRAKLAPIVTEWYPTLVQLLRGKGFEAPKSIVFVCKHPEKENAAPAWAGGKEVTLNANWFMKNLKGEAGGAVVHEMVHLVQDYGGKVRKANPTPTKTPGWLVEGIADYIRWFLYEPQTRGARIGPKQAAKVNYDGSYRTTANFINWVTQKYDKTIVLKLNDACRRGLYTDALWHQYTGRTLQELNDEWKTYLANQPPK